MKCVVKCMVGVSFRVGVFIEVLGFYLIEVGVMWVLLVGIGKFVVWVKDVVVMYFDSLFVLWVWGYIFVMVWGINRDIW